MEELYNYNLNDSDIKEMISINNDILSLSNEEIKNIVELLLKINCNDKQIRNILISNPFYLSRCISDVIDLIKKLMNLGITSLNILFDSNPWLLNKDVFELDDYINQELNNKTLEEIVDELESNPYIIDEIGV